MSKEQIHQSAAQKRDNLAEWRNSLMAYFQSDDVVELYFDGHGRLQVLREAQKIEKADLSWTPDQYVEYLMELVWESKIRLDPFRPYGGGVLLGKPWRWHAIIPPMAPNGPILVFRRQRFDLKHISDFVLENFDISTLSQSLAQGVSLIVFGATGTGKSTFLMAILREYFSGLRIGFAESVAELPMLSDHWFKLVAVAEDTSGKGGVDFSCVLTEMLRMSPTGIVVGEVRGHEAKQFIDFARTGHGSIFTTLHAGSYRDVLARLSRWAQCGELELPPILGLHIRQEFGRYIVRKMTD